MFISIIDNKVTNSDYSQIIPNLEDFVREPPLLPPQLRNIILNKVIFNH